MKFSIILPVYNKANTIVQAIDSIYSQTCQDFEIIIINDGSTDNLLDVLNKYAKPIKVISQENKGVSVARNRGVDSAVGEYVCFLDADDMWYPNHLEVILNMMNRFPEVGYFGTCHKSSFPDGTVIDGNTRINKLGDVIFVEDLIGFVNKYGGVLNTNSVCVKRSIITDEKIYFEPGEKLGEDVDVWYRIALKHPIAISTKMTTLYRREYSTATVVTSNATDWCFAKRQQSILNDIDITRNVKESYKAMCDRYYLTISREYCFNHSKKDAYKWMKKVSSKISIRYFVSLLLCVTPSFILDIFPEELRK